MFHLGCRLLQFVFLCMCVGFLVLFLGGFKERVEIFVLYKFLPKKCLQSKNLFTESELCCWAVSLVQFLFLLPYMLASCPLIRLAKMLSPCLYYVSFCPFF